MYRMPRERENIIAENDLSYLWQTGGSFPHLYLSNNCSSKSGKLLRICSLTLRHLRTNITIADEDAEPMVRLQVSPPVEPDSSY